MTLSIRIINICVIELMHVYLLMCFEIGIYEKVSPSQVSACKRNNFFSGQSNISLKIAFINERVLIKIKQTNAERVKKFAFEMP